jgi:hypothetical protein
LTAEFRRFEQQSVRAALPVAVIYYHPTESSARSHRIKPHCADRKAMIPNTQWVKLMSIVAFLTAIACTTNTRKESAGDSLAVVVPDTSQVQASSQPEIPAVDSVARPEEHTVALNAQLEPLSDSLYKHFDTLEVDLINRAVTESKAIASAAKLAHFYQVILRDSLQPLIEQKFRAGCRHNDYGSFADDDWDWISEGMPFIATRMSCHNGPAGTTCVHEAPISLLPLRAIATQTPQPEDDLYFDVAIAIHTGTEPGAQVETEVFDGQEDYEPRQPGGCSGCTVGMLGDGHRSDVVRKLAQAAGARKTFNKAITSELNNLFASLKEERYYHSKDAILHELDLIITTGTGSKLLTNREVATLQETQQWVMAKEGGFDCGSGGCEQVVKSSLEP